jgi:hypothetical protein
VGGGSAALSSGGRPRTSNSSFRDWRTFRLDDPGADRVSEKQLRVPEEGLEPSLLVSETSVLPIRRLRSETAVTIPGEGLEPSLLDPKASVLPLDDPGAEARISVGGTRTLSLSTSERLYHWTTTGFRGRGSNPRKRGTPAVLPLDDPGVTQERLRSGRRESNSPRSGWKPGASPLGHTREST